MCVDEKSQIQALDRSQPGLPMKKGRCGTMPHDYKRHGTTTLFAALNVLEGTVIADCMPRHRNQEFLKFLRRLDREFPAQDLHLILDNYGNPQAPQHQTMVSQAAPLPSPLHSYQRLLAQSDRTLVREFDSKENPSRRLSQRPGTHQHHQRLRQNE